MIKKEKKLENINNKLLIISDSVENDKLSVSKQMSDLTVSLSSYYRIDLITQTPKKIISQKIVKSCNNIFFLNTLFRKNKKNILRGFSELFFGLKIAFVILSKKKAYKGIIWYSPSIFIGLGIYLSSFQTKNIKKIMIIRDIFPDWLLEIDYYKENSIIYLFLKKIQKIQFSICDVILTQSEYDKNLIQNKIKVKNQNISILYSWYDINYNFISDNFIKSLINKTPYVVSIGDIGIAQDLNNFSIFIYKICKSEPNLNILLVGLRENSLKQFRYIKNEYKIKNLFLYEQINQALIPSLCSNASCGIFSLNNNLKSNNIPGRFVMYVLNGLKVFGIFLNNSELSKIIDQNSFGEYFNYKDKDLINNFTMFYQNLKYEKKTIRNKAKNLFSTYKAVKKIMFYL